VGAHMSCNEHAASQRSSSGHGNANGLAARRPSTNDPRWLAALGVDAKRRHSSMHGVYSGGIGVIGVNMDAGQRSHGEGRTRHRGFVGANKVRSKMQEDAAFRFV
jgi:hypothetical protein